jgi:nitroreductase
MNTDLIDLICSTRAMRRLRPDPVPPELINQILRAATAAPPASNVYGWRFLVIRDQAIKDAIATKYRRRWHDECGPP